MSFTLTIALNVCETTLITDKTITDMSMIVAQTPDTRDVSFLDSIATA